MDDRPQGTDGVAGTANEFLVGDLLRREVDLALSMGDLNKAKILLDLAGKVNSPKAFGIVEAATQALENRKNNHPWRGKLCAGCKTRKEVNEKSRCEKCAKCPLCSGGNFDEDFVCPACIIENGGERILCTRCCRLPVKGKSTCQQCHDAEFQYGAKGLNEFAPNPAPLNSSPELSTATLIVPQQGAAWTYGKVV